MKARPGREVARRALQKREGSPHPAMHPATLPRARMPRLLEELASSQSLSSRHMSPGGTSGVARFDDAYRVVPPGEVGQDPASRGVAQLLAQLRVRKKALRTLHERTQIPWREKYPACA